MPKSTGDGDQIPEEAGLLDVQAEQLRQLPSADRTVLIALTGYGNESQKKQAFSAGFHFHLTKPVALERLEGILAEHIVPSDMRAKDQPGNQLLRRPTERTGRD